MGKSIKVFFDSSVFSNSIKDISSLSQEHNWLMDQIKAIDELHMLYLKGVIEINFDANIFFEGWRRNSNEKEKIQQKWGDIKPGPTFIGFKGTMVNCPVKKGWEKRLKELKQLFRDDSLDVNHLANAELYSVKYFLTTDRRLINKANNEGKGKLRIKVLSPSEFLKIYHSTKY